MPTQTLPARLLAAAAITALAAGAAFAGDGHDHHDHDHSDNAHGDHAHGETRELGAHVHGVGGLTLVREGTDVLMSFEAPGFDIVGFESPSTTDAQREAIEAALTVLVDPLALFQPSADAGCALVSAEAMLLGDPAFAKAHDDHDHGHEDHSHGHSDHAHGDHDHDHHDHGEAADSHTEFRADYALTCSNPDALTTMGFPYFDMFEGAEKLEIQIVGDGGQAAFEATRDAPTVDLGGVI